MTNVGKMVGTEGVIERKKEETNRRKGEGREIEKTSRVHLCEMEMKLNL